MSERVSGIHHINVLVRDLDRAEAQYRAMLGLGPAVRESLPVRGVDTARFRLGEVWLVLVQPTGEQGEPARMLRERGEGLMLLSFAVENLEEAMAAAVADGACFSGSGERTGLAGWRVVDFDDADTPGVLLQLTEAGDGS